MTELNELFAQWRKLGKLPGGQLSEARLQSHWATQVIASVGLTYVEPAPDDSHTNMEWLDESGLLAGRWTREPDSFRVALRLQDLTLIRLDKAGAPPAEFPLSGRTLQEAVDWVQSHVGSSEPSIKTELEKPGYEIPIHPVAANEPFRIDQIDSHQELFNLYRNSSLLLETARADRKNASRIACWPHHFDIAFLIRLDPEMDPEEARSVGVGMSPGDGNYADPYWYVTPWPYPGEPEYAELAGKGHWHTEGWIGAILTISDLISDDPVAEARQVLEFVQSGINGSLSMLGDNHLE